MRSILIIACLTAPAAPALAGNWTAPEGCEVFMTVQAKACRVSNHYRCLGDAEGDQWRADFDQEGVFFYSRIDFEGQWVESYTLNPTVRQVLDSQRADSASFSELLETGIDTWDFGMTRNDGSASQARGYDRLTGRTVVIDGITLSETEVEFIESDVMGNTLRRAQGNEYLHPEWRLFFAGPGETDLGDGRWIPIDGSPVEFIFPGEDGFLDTQPKYDCDVLSANARPIQTILPAPQILPASLKE
ncbi:hypothetical protein [Tabrizicola sp.]|uniref:hypothetical protein n=1 Tax=Tabrizicola sp. TaxID=2005166 RepID=UPI0026392535|nr:hypothetical protein [Tabrizicola sp.]MDM7931723.1 hypothetical protein [Tabrizicola sp.]